MTPVLALFVQDVVIPTIPPAPQITGLDSLSTTVLMTAVVAQLVTFLGVVAGLIFNFLRDGRTRKWLREDRDFLAGQTKTTASELATHTSTVSHNLESLALRKVDDIENRLKGLLAEVVAARVASDAAQKEANNMNHKLETMGIERRIPVAAVAVAPSDPEALARAVAASVALEMARLWAAHQTPIPRASDGDTLTQIEHNTAATATALEKPR